MSDRKLYGSVFLYIIAGICIGVFIKLFVLDILFVSGPSMEPTIRDGDIIFVSKLAYGIPRPFGTDLLVSWAKPKTGDIVIYIYNNSPVVKRCAAVEGDTLAFFSTPEYEMQTGQSRIPLSEQQYMNIKSSSEVPERTILAVGDNYAESVDSRNYGFISIRNILGKVLWK